MHRRNFLKTIAATGVSLGIANISTPQSNKSNTIIRKVITSDNSKRNYFPQSILSAEPRQNSIVLWTRIKDNSHADSDLPLILQVAKDDEFKNLVVQYEAKAEANSDHCISVKVTDLEPSRHYFYRFLYLKNGEFYSSKTGRTKTAPASGETRSLKFAQVCCQDYVGRYYNAYFKLLEQDDLDFVVFLGDYIYETTRDPRFQTQAGRKVVFNDEEGALQLGEKNSPFYAAKSLDNYRQLYQIYRSDPLLQQVHERFPMIAIWDDHEFADDSFGAHSTHTAGRKNEKDLQRKYNSEQAFFEYMPVDLNDKLSNTTENLIQNEGNQYPETQIYRSFNFGKNLELVLTDFRTYRPDHLIPEDAFPGTVIFNETTLGLLLLTQGIDFNTIKKHFIPYIDIDEPALKDVKELLVKKLIKAYQTEGLDEISAIEKVKKVVTGYLSIRQINKWIEDDWKLDESKADGVGFTYELLGKIELFGEVGSRYFIVKQAYDLLSSVTYKFNKESQNALGERQELWLKDHLLSSKANWKFLANSVSMNSFLLDLRDPKLDIPKPFNQNFYMNVDHWDGFPNKRSELLDILQNVENLNLLSGDLHASLVGVHNKTIKEFTGPSLSSSPQKKMISDVAKRNSVLAKLPRLESLLEQGNRLVKNANDQLEFAEISKNGVVIHELDEQVLTSHYYLLSEELTRNSYYEDPDFILSEMEQKTFINKKV